MTFQIDTMTADDWPDLRRIYEEGLASGVGSFETTAPSWEEWDAARMPHSRLVARRAVVVGWAALSPVSQRSCYAGVAEVGIYVAAAERSRGIGRALLEALIEAAEAQGIWTLQGATIAENAASLGLQERCGFRVVGRRERIAKRDGKWHDTILTERRSEKVGLEYTADEGRTLPRDETAQADMTAAIEYVRSHAADLGIDGERIGLWAFSGGGPLLSGYLRERPSCLRCIVAFYAMLDLRHIVPPDADPGRIARAQRFSPAAYVREQSAGLPMFVARAGLDAAMVNDSIDLFVREALAANATLDVANHPQGRHAFDVLDDDERSREIIARAVAFVRTHLSTA